MIFLMPAGHMAPVSPMNIVRSSSLSMCAHVSMDSPSLRPWKPVHDMASISSAIVLSATVMGIVGFWRNLLLAIFFILFVK